MKFFEFDELVDVPIWTNLAVQFLYVLNKLIIKT